MNNILLFLFLLQINSVFPFLHVNKYKYSYELAMKTTPVLINDVIHKWFKFSDAFNAMFVEEYNVSVPLYDPFFPNNVHNNSGIEARYDKRVLNIYHRLGDIRETVTTQEVPNDLLPYIHIIENDERETLTINISKKYKDLLLEIINSKDALVVEEQMNKYKKYLDKNWIDYL